MTDLKVYVANYLGQACTVTRSENGFIRDILTFNCDGYEIQAQQEKEIVLNTRRNYKGKFVPSTTMTIVDVSEQEVEKVLNVIDRICWLLSFASMSSGMVMNTHQEVVTKVSIL